MRNLSLRDLAGAAGVSYRKAQRAVQSSLLPSLELYEQDHAETLRRAHDRPDGYLTATEAEGKYGVSPRQLDNSRIATIRWDPPYGQPKRLYLEKEVAAFKPPGCIHAFALAAEEKVKRSWIVAMCKDSRFKCHLVGNSWWIEDSQKMRMLIRVARSANEEIRA